MKIFTLRAKKGFSGLAKRFMNIDALILLKACRLFL